MQLIVVLNTLEPLMPLLPDFVRYKVICCERVWQFNGMNTLKEWIDAHSEQTEDIEQAYSQLAEDKQLGYRTFELDVGDGVDVEMLVDFLNALDAVLFVEINQNYIIRKK